MAIAVSGCAERRPFPEARFREIAKRCDFVHVTYTPAPSRNWLGIEAPTVDFSREADPSGAMACFDEKDLAISQEISSEADLGVTFDMKFIK
jgi:hypothetical protein